MNLRLSSNALALRTFPRGCSWLVLAVAYGLLAFSRVNGATGDLDPTFGSAGKVTTAIGSSGDYSSSMALQSDGRILVVGYSNTGNNYDFALARYNVNGSLDTTFGGTGKVTTDFGNSNDYGAGLAVQNDGKIIVAGDTGSSNDRNFALARFTPNGSLDATFNGTGKVSTDLGTPLDSGRCVALQSNGKIVVAGVSRTDPTFYHLALVRYNNDGTIDTSFGGTGYVATKISAAGYDHASSMAIQPDGKILVAAQSLIGSSYDFAIVRYNTNGSLDTMFNGTGIVTTDFGGGTEGAPNIALQSDGKILAVGSTAFGTFRFGVARYLPNGSLDSSFNGAGKVTTQIGFDDRASAVAVQSDGKIVVSGNTSNGGMNLFALVRYNASGTLDTTFNLTGKVTTIIEGSGYETANCVAVQKDGKIVVAGVVQNPAYFNFALARYLGATPSGEILWPAQNGYAHPLSKTSSALRSGTDAQFLSPDYETSEQRRHVGIDLVKAEGPTANGDPVYAIDDGEIVYFRRRLAPDGWESVVFIRHFTGTGTAFWAIYGHCNLLDAIHARPAQLLPTDLEEVSLDATPITITKGRQIGTIIPAGGPHLHFGINTSSDRSNFFAGVYGWGRVPLGTLDAYIYDTLKWRTPINQDSLVLLGFLNDPANSNNEPEQYSNWQTRSFAGSTVDPAQQSPDADADGDGILKGASIYPCFHHFAFS